MAAKNNLGKEDKMYKWFKAALLTCLISSIFSPAFAAKGFSDFLDPPMLLSPTKEYVNLAGKDFLKFSWETTDEVNTDHYEFKLYKGYGGAANLISSEELSGFTGSIQLATDQFVDGQVYTWTLRRVDWRGIKSDLSSASFMAIKK
jgi:hypothetical protein